jgi:general secretion pathway protein G
VKPPLRTKTLATKVERGGVRATGASCQRGFTLVELIVATAILVILTGLAVPMARVAIMREKERQLRHDLWELRDAIRPL